MPAAPHTPFLLPSILFCGIVLAYGCDPAGEIGADDDATTSSDDDDTAPPDDDTTGASDDDTTVAPDDDTTVAPDDDTTPPPVASWSATLGPVHFSPGEEVTYCVERRLGNDEEAFINRIASSITSGGHHMILYRSNATEERPDAFECTPFLETLYGENVPLMVSQIAKEELVFPEGVATRISANQMVRIETHFINTNAAEVDASVEVTLSAMAPELVVHEADFLFLGSPDIWIGPGQTETLGPRYVQFPDSMADIEVFAATGHTHQYGLDVSAWRSMDEEDLEEKIYPTTDKWYWDEPEVAYYEEPLTFPEGSGVNIECTWQNTSEHGVGFGESANDEMCFMWAYYYPSQGYKLCVQTDYAGYPLSLCCPSEDLLCDLLDEYLDDI